MLIYFRSDKLRFKSTFDPKRYVALRSTACGIPQKKKSDATSKKVPTSPPRKAMTTGKAPNVIVWVDLETTGLDEKFDVPLELGVKVTDLDLTVLHQESWYIREEGWLEKLERNTLVREMHEKSGLIDELVGLPEYRRTPDGQIMSWGSNQAAFLAWRWLTEDLGLPSGEYPMAGSSVHFDRKFAERHLLVFNAFFTHRHIDVSTLKELAKRYRPDIYNAMKNDPRFDKKNAKHRGLADIDATLKELKQYLMDFLWLLNGTPGSIHDQQSVLPVFE